MHGSGGRGPPPASQVWRADLHGAAPLALLANKPRGFRTSRAFESDRPDVFSREAFAVVVSRDRGQFGTMHTLFAVLGSAVNFAACLGYVRAILKGEAAPNRVTWFLWALVPLIAGAAQPVGWVERSRNPSTSFVSVAK